MPTIRVVPAFPWLEKSAFPVIGSIEFENLSCDELLFDLQNRFKNREIFSLYDYIGVLEEHYMQKPILKIFENQLIFERALAYR